MRPVDRFASWLLAVVIAVPLGAAAGKLLWPEHLELATGLAIFVLTIATALAVVPRDEVPPAADHGYQPNGGKADES